MNGCKHESARRFHNVDRIAVLRVKSAAPCDLPTPSFRRNLFRPGALTPGNASVSCGVAQASLPADKMSALRLHR
jgi:hypothetical protein